MQDIREQGHIKRTCLRCEREFYTECHGPKFLCGDCYEIIHCDGCNNDFAQFKFNKDLSHSAEVCCNSCHVTMMHKKGELENSKNLETSDEKKIRVL